jgi:tetratricopeptide (TPR) repeat protein
VRWSGEEVQTRCDALAIRHHRQPDKQHKTDLTLLQQAVRENPLDSRMAWYFARELDYAGDSEAAVEAFKRYLRMAGGSPTERAYACRVLARLDKEHANRHLLSSMLESPHEPEAYVMLVNMAWQMGDSVGALYWARQAKRCHADNMTHASIPAAYGDATMAIGASAAMAVGLHKEALDFAREAFRRNPADRQHAANVAALAELQDEEGPKP